MVEAVKRNGVVCDLAQWGHGSELTGPIEVEGRGGFPQRGLFNVATSYHIEWTYGDGVKLIGDDQGREIVCVAFEASEGWVHIGSQLDAEPKWLLTSVLGPNEFHLPDVGDHHGNFLECLRTRQRPLAPLAEAHRSATICHLGNIAMKLGRKLRWNPATEEFVDDPEAMRECDKSTNARRASRSSSWSASTSAAVTNC